MFKRFTLTAALILAALATAGPAKAASTIDGYFAGSSTSFAFAVFATSPNTSRGMPVFKNTDGTWLFSQGDMSASTYSGTLSEARNGQVLGGAYKSPSISTVGSVSIAWSRPESATITLNGISSSVSRVSLASTGPMGGSVFNAPITGYRADLNALGIGWFIEVQGATTRLEVYTYNDAGRSRWLYVSCEMVMNANAVGTCSGPLLDGGTGASAGTVTIQSSTNTKLVITLPDGQQITTNYYQF